METVTGTKNSIKLRFAGLYLLSLALIVFILFPFMEGFSTKPASATTPVLPVSKQSEDNTELVQKQEKALADYQSSLAQAKNDLKDRDAKIVLLESRIDELQEATKNNSSKPQVVGNSANEEKLKVRLSQLEKQVGTLTQLNNDLKRRNEYLSAQVSSQKK